LIGSPLITIISWLYFIPDFGMCIPLALMPLPTLFHIFQYTGYQKYRWYKQAISAMPINCKGINASGIHIPKSGIKYNQLIIVIIVSKGSTKTVLQELALDIFSACLKFNVNIDMVWIPR
jgi:hypothetical protein